MVWQRHAPKPFDINCAKHIIRDLLLSHFASPIHTIWASTQHEQNILLWSTERCITVAPCEGYGVLNHWPIDCWFNSLLDITTQKTSNVVGVVSLNKLLNQLSRWPRLHIPGYFSGEYIGGFPFKKANNVESVSMPWRYMGQVTKLRLSCYLVLLSIDSKTR